MLHQSDLICRYLPRSVFDSYLYCTKEIVEKIGDYLIFYRIYTKLFNYLHENPKLPNCLQRIYTKILNYLIISRIYK